MAVQLLKAGKRHFHQCSRAADTLTHEQSGVLCRKAKLHFRAGIRMIEQALGKGGKGGADPSVSVHFKDDRRRLFVLRTHLAASLKNLGIVYMETHKRKVARRLLERSAATFEGLLRSERVAAGGKEAEELTGKLLDIQKTLLSMYANASYGGLHEEDMVLFKQTAAAMASLAPGNETHALNVACAEAALGAVARGVGMASIQLLRTKVAGCRFSLYKLATAMPAVAMRVAVGGEEGGGGGGGGGGGRGRFVAEGKEEGEGMYMGMAGMIVGTPGTPKGTPMTPPETPPPSVTAAAGEGESGGGRGGGGSVQASTPSTLAFGEDPSNMNISGTSSGILAVDFDTLGEDELTLIRAKLEAAGGGGGSGSGGGGGPGVGGSPRGAGGGSCSSGSGGGGDGGGGDGGEGGGGSGGGAIGHTDLEVDERIRAAVREAKEEAAREAAEALRAVREEGEQNLKAALAQAALERERAAKNHLQMNDGGTAVGGAEQKQTQKKPQQKEKKSVTIASSDSSSSSSSGGGGNKAASPMRAVQFAPAGFVIEAVNLVDREAEKREEGGARRAAASTPRGWLGSGGAVVNRRDPLVRNFAELGGLLRSVQLHLALIEETVAGGDGDGGGDEEGGGGEADRADGADGAGGGEDEQVGKRPVASIWSMCTSRVNNRRNSGTSNDTPSDTPSDTLNTPTAASMKASPGSCRPNLSEDLDAWAPVEAGSAAGSPTARSLSAGSPSAGSPTAGSPTTSRTGSIGNGTADSGAATAAGSVGLGSVSGSVVGSVEGGGLDLLQLLNIVGRLRQEANNMAEMVTRTVAEAPSFPAESGILLAAQVHSVVLHLTVLEKDFDSVVRGGEKPQFRLAVKFRRLSQEVRNLVEIFANAWEACQGKQAGGAEKHEEAGPFRGRGMTLGIGADQGAREEGARGGSSGTGK